MGNRTTPTGSLFALGERVQVTDPNAPWYGSTGEVTGHGVGNRHGPYAVLLVRLDGMKTAVAHYAKELTRA